MSVAAHRHTIDTLSIVAISTRAMWEERVAAADRTIQIIMAAAADRSIQIAVSFAAVDLLFRGAADTTVVEIGRIPLLMKTVVIK